MKKLLVLLLAAVMVFSLVACGNPQGGNTDKTYEVIMLMDLPNGSVDDGSFCEATWQGIVKYCNETGTTHTYMTPNEESKEAYLSLIDQAVKVGGKVCTFRLAVPLFLFQASAP